MFEDCAVEARILYSVLDPLLTPDWTPLSSYETTLSKISHQLPPRPWRTQLQELSSRSLLAYSVIHGVEHVSSWRDRFPKKFSYLILTGVYPEHLTDYSDFSWDLWSDIMRGIGVPTESLYQLNKTYVAASLMCVVSSANNGTRFKINKAST